VSKREEKEMQVVLLTQEQCDFCAQAKAILERLQQEYPLTLTMLDLRTPEGEALAARHGLLFPPGLLLDGEPFSYGRLSERKLRKELERRRHA
jgi:glutaredoxin